MSAMPKCYMQQFESN